MAKKMSSRLVNMAIEAMLEGHSDLGCSLVESYRLALEAEDVADEMVSASEAAEMLFRVYCERRPTLSVEKAGELFCGDAIEFPSEVPVTLVRLLAASMALRDVAEERALREMYVASRPAVS